MTVNERKTKVQDKALLLSKSNKALCLEFSTGVGKTLAALRIAENIIKKNPNAKGYLICKETTHKKNWLEEFDKHNMNDINKSLNTFLYASAKNKTEKVDFIILDECHALTHKRVEAIKKTIGSNTKLIFLSATISNEKKYLMSLLSKDIHYFIISLREAIEQKLVPEPSLIIHNIWLKNDNNRIYEYIFEKGIKKSRIKTNCLFKDRWTNLKRFNAVELTVFCNQKEYYDLISDQIDYFKKKSTDMVNNYITRQHSRNKFLNLSSARKRFIAEAKTWKSKELVKDFLKNNTRFVCFTGSIAQANEISNNTAIHSENSREWNQELIDCFNRMECSSLFTVKMLRESINLSMIEKGIVVQLDSTISSFYQMLGRCLRHDFPELHLIVMRNTQDEIWFNSSMKGFDMKFIKQIK